MLTILATAGGLAAGLAGALFAAMALRPQRRTSANEKALTTFRNARRELIDNYQVLAHEALAVNRHWQQSQLPTLGQTDWILPSPIPLDKVDIALESEAADTRRDVALRMASYHWPRDPLGLPIKTYAEAIEAYDKPNLWWDSDTYCLCKVSIQDSGLQLIFSLQRYFDGVNTQDVLSFEAARHKVSNRDLSPVYARLRGGPCDLVNRYATASIVTLTLIRDADRSFFLLHYRNPKSVATGGGTYHVTPAGEFEPTNLSPNPEIAGFNLWSNVMREYAEEFLGLEEYKGGKGFITNYRLESPFRELNEAVMAGKVAPWCLGLALNPLSWKPELLTVVVFENDIFQELFPSIDVDDEGTKMGLFPFDKKNVEDFLSSPKINPIAHAALATAWEMRASLLGPTAEPQSTRESG